jgi:hypothetical protein
MFTSSRELPESQSQLGQEISYAQTYKSKDDGGVAFDGNLMIGSGHAVFITENPYGIQSLLQGIKINPVIVGFLTSNQTVVPYFKRVLFVLVIAFQKDS